MTRSYYPKARCRWCKREYTPERTLLGKPIGKLCPRCRKRHAAGGKPPKHDAMYRRARGHYGAKEGG